MARIDMTGLMYGVGVGVVDEVLERMDVKAGRTENLKSYRDYFRMFGVGGGLAGQIFGIMPAQAKTLADACTPLLTKSVAKMVWKETAPTGVPMMRYSSPTKAYQPIFPKPRLI